ncbi:response regulator transcription factor [Neobacillus cucumis]|uniref:DNA-binding response regulator n=1 Tax=Neobacillus cucumis TaxID=1740721 RepID=A0A2N5HJC6_9BACI|nr:response regulator [Neobacillus cucumis]PLS05598.1 DNA-binding response regulator [Neobacillus cucumis]
MYKVMLVDDDYPVLELLTEAIEWEQLGVTLQSTHENGASAYENALDEMPDILITDIGMPKMNGIELTKHLKELNPNLQVVILSCHSEFEFAKQALKLQVHDYLVKDVFDPDDLCEVIKKVKENLDHQNNTIFMQQQLQQMLERNRENVKERFIRKTIQQSPISEKEWLTEASALGLHLDKREYTPALAFVHDFHLAKHRCLSEENLIFAINNIMDELIKGSKLDVVHFYGAANEFFLFFPCSKLLKAGSFNQTMESMNKIQKALKTYLNIHVSFLFGNECSSLPNIKEELSLLLNAKHQSFYMQPGTILKREYVQVLTDDLFSKYDEVSSDFRDLLLMKDKNQIIPIVSKWINYLEEKRYPPELVKEWLLKLLLDLKIKLHALQLFRQDHHVECLHQEIITSNFLCELRDLLINYFKSFLYLSNQVYNQTKRREILDAISYVSMNLEKRISLEEVASYLFLNQSYFSRLFKREMGETFVEYVTKLKIIRAKELLEQTTSSVGNICERLGYDNQSYFIKLFKNHVGVTPIEYRGGKVSAG